MDNKNFLGKKLNAIWQEMRALPSLFEKLFEQQEKTAKKVDESREDFTKAVKEFAAIVADSNNGEKTVVGTVKIDQLYEEIERALKETATEPFVLDYEELSKLFDKNTPLSEIKLSNVQEIAQALKEALPETPAEFKFEDKPIEIFGKALVKIEGNSANNPVFVQLSDGKNPIDLKEIFRVSLSVPAGGGGGGEAVASSPTAVYGYCAKSETATYQYLFYEDKDENWYILRRNLTTEVVDYGKGIGGYQSVYTSPTTAPSPAPTYDTYGATF